MAAERYLSQCIPDLRVGNDIDKIDKKPVPSIYVPGFPNPKGRGILKQMALV